MFAKFESCCQVRSLCVGNGVSNHTGMSSHLFSLISFLFRSPIA